MRIDTAWLRSLRKGHRQEVLPSLLRMLRLHATPFSVLLNNIFEVTERYGAKFTFPVTASVALKNPALIHEVLRSGHEVAVHGFKHRSYGFLSTGQQEDDVKAAVTAFKGMNTPVYGFRAPYNIYTEDTLRLLEKYGFLWDGGIGYNPRYRECRGFFRVSVNGHNSGFICIPLNKWSDDIMIETYGLQSRQIGRVLRRVINRVRERHGLVMFDLHPIRIGQSKYIEGLRQALAYGTELNGWFPTVTEAVKYWNQYGEWEHGATFCCLMTGDIDNFVFLDYLRRVF